MTKAAAVVAALAAFIAAPNDARAQTPAPGPFTTTLSNTVPLAFGMTPDDATAVLGAPLVYVEGRPGSEVFVTLRNASVGFSYRSDPLFLQFRDGRLTGWKADWSRNWMWR